MRHLSLYAGEGWFDRGLEAAGPPPVAQVGVARHVSLFPAGSRSFERHLADLGVETVASISAPPYGWGAADVVSVIPDTYGSDWNDAFNEVMVRTGAKWLVISACNEWKREHGLDLHRTLSGKGMVLSYDAVRAPGRLFIPMVWGPKPIDVTPPADVDLWIPGTGDDFSYFPKGLAAHLIGEMGYA